MNKFFKPHIRHHIIFIQNDKVILEDYVAYVFEKLKKTKKELEFELVELNKINRYKPIDGKYNTPLNLTGFGSAIIMHFNSQEKLKNYYEKILHSNIRREVYEKLNPDVINEYKALDNLMLDPMNNKKDIVKQFNKIESRMKKYILRIDVYPT